MNGGGLRRLNNFNPARDMAGKDLTGKAAQLFKNFGAATGEASRMAGSKAPDQIQNGFDVGERYGSMDVYKKKLADVNQRLIDANKKFYDPNTSARDKENLRTEILTLESEKKILQRTGKGPVTSPPGNAGTSGNNSANSGNNNSNNTGNSTSTSGPSTGGGPNNSNGGGGGSNPFGGARPNGGAGAGSQAGGTGSSGTTGGGGNYNQANGNSSTGSNATGNNASGNNASGPAAARAAKKPTPHDLLGVDENATWDEIKKAYRKKTLKNHPDRGGDAEIFIGIKDAYETLQKDPRYANKGKASAPNPGSTTAPTPSTNEPGPTTSDKPVNRSMNLLSGIQGYTPGTLAPRGQNSAPIGTLSLRTNTPIKPAIATNTGSIAPTTGSTQAPAAIALGNGAQSAISGVSVSNTGTITPIVPRQFGDGQGPKPTYTPVQQKRIFGKAITSQSRGTEVLTGINRKQEAQQSASKTITQKISSIEIPLSSISPLASITPLANKTVSVGAVVDTVAKLDTPLTQFIPVVGPELKLAGKVASTAKNIGVIKPMQMDIPLPPSK
jgi:curved DNA-binding protein CbpA